MNRITRKYKGSELGGQVPMLLRAVAVVAPLLFILGGCYVLWIKETGAPAKVQVTECRGYGKREVCMGMATIGDLLQGGSVQSVTFDDVTRADLGKTLDARVSGDRAYTTSLRLPIVLIGAGVALLAGFVHVLRNYGGRGKPSPVSQMRVLPVTASIRPPLPPELRDMVDRALAQTRERAQAGNPVYASIEKQLQWIARVLDSDVRPDLDAVNRLTLGAIAVREFDAVAPEYADLLSKIDYDFGRWAIA